MTRWTRREYALMLLHPVCAVVTLYGTPLLSILPGIDMIGLWLIPLIPALFSAGLVCVLKRRGKRLWVAGLVLAAFLLVCGLFIVEVLPFQMLAKIDRFFTGRYNLEAAGFGLWYAVLYCVGLLLGVPLGKSLARILPPGSPSGRAVSRQAD